MNPILRRLIFPAFFLALAAYGYVTLRGPQGVPALMQKRREIRQLEEENANLQRDIENQRERLRRLEQSPSQQDLEIRKKLRRVHENEMEFILPSAVKATEPGAQRVR